MASIKNPVPFAATLPGEILDAELKERGIKQKEFAEAIGIGASHLNEFIKGKRPLTAELALRLERALGIDSEFWMNLQMNYELTLARIRQREMKAELDSIGIVPDEEPQNYIRIREGKVESCFDIILTESDSGRSIAYVPALDLICSDDSMEDVKRLVAAMISDFIRINLTNRTLDRELSDLGWTKRMNTFMPPALWLILEKNKDARRITSRNYQKVSETVSFTC